jgi:hypothetical protein
MTSYSLLDGERGPSNVPGETMSTGEFSDLTVFKTPDNILSRKRDEMTTYPMDLQRKENCGCDIKWYDKKYITIVLLFVIAFAIAYLYVRISTP